VTRHERQELHIPLSEYHTELQDTSSKTTTDKTTTDKTTTEEVIRKRHQFFVGVVG
jgi:hypothetical protein